MRTPRWAMLSVLTATVAVVLGDVGVAQAAETNFALNALATASLQNPQFFPPPLPVHCSLGSGPENAVDGAASNIYTDKWCVLSGKPVLTIQLPASTQNSRVDRIVVKHAGAGGESPALNTRAFRLDVATLPYGAQTRVATVTANTANVTSHPVGRTGVTAVYLSIDTPTQGTNQATRIFEVEVWGTASTCLLPGQKLINSGFEFGQAPWVAPLGVIGVHGVAYNGSWSARLSGDNWQTPSLSQTALLPVGCKLMLGYRLKVDSDEIDASVRDSLTVQVNSTTVATYSNANESSGWLTGWIDVSSFAGKTVTVRFTATGDLSFPTRFFLDDVGVWAE